MFFVMDYWTLGPSVGVIVGLIYLFLWYRNHVFSYWEHIGVPSLPIGDVLFGNLRQPIFKQISWSTFYQRSYDAFKANGFGGIYIFSHPTLVICDPNLVEKVLVEDFTHFQDRFPAGNNCQDLLSNALFQTTGEKWRIMRSKLLPAFTSGKVKGMFSQVFSCCNYIISQITDPNTDINSVEIEQFALSFATETIASCSFGIQIMSDPVERDKFKRVVQLIYNPPPRQVLKYALFWMNPKILAFLRMKLMISEVTEYFVNMTRATMEFRDQSNVKRDDFLQLMIQLKKQEETFNNDKKHKPSRDHGGSINATTERIFTEDCIASQMFNLINAGSTPSKVVISFVLFELSKNVEVQMKAQKDIDLAISKHQGWNYEALKDMTYLDQVIQETLRLHSYSPVLVRTVIEPYNIPGTQITLRKNTSVYIPTAAIHMDPQFYPSPELFDPERFVGNNYKPSSIYMPFGHGPRICISIKYAIFMIKVFLARMLAEYNVGVSSNMKFPVTLDRSVYFPQVEGGIWLSLEKRNK